MPDIYIGALDFDDSPPVVSNRFPASGATAVSTITAVSFDLADAGSGIDTASIDVTVAGIPAVVDGVAAPGYSLSLVPMADGYSVQITGFALDFAELILVQVYAQDLAGIFNSVSDSWSFTTKSLPLISDLAPPDGSIDVALLPTISFNATDATGTIDPLSIQLIVASIPAVVDGIIQTGFTGSIDEIIDGYSVEVTPDTEFSGSLSVSVYAEVSDTLGNASSETWAFVTEEAEATVVFLMRARKIIDDSFVNWITPNPNDPFNEAPFPAIQLTDVVVSEIIELDTSGPRTFIMRAYRAASVEFVYWASSTPDTAAAPYPAIELSDPVVIHLYTGGPAVQLLLAQEDGGLIMQENEGYIVV